MIMSLYTPSENVPTMVYYSSLDMNKKEDIIIRKVILTMDEQKKYEVIKGLVDHPGSSKERAALTLGCTMRHINRMIVGYQKHGKEFFVHGNKGRTPAKTIQDGIRSSVVDLYRTKYYDANFEHYTELLAKYERIFISSSSVTNILEAEFILSPKVTKAKKKRIKKTLLALKKSAKTQKEADAVQINLVAVEDAHSRRPRAAYFGELIQIDATPFEWIPGIVWHLHAAIDDATGRMVAAWFDMQETLNGYYHIFHQILSAYGIPYKFFTDRRTVFTYKKKNAPSLDEDTYTQFSYACSQFGVELESSSVPQAKGRVERLNQTLQSRLPIELRLAGITTMDDANEFLNSHIKEFNEKFALPLNGIRSVFVEQPSNEKINLTLAVLCERTVDTGHCLRHEKKYYRMLDKSGLQVHYRKGTKTMLIQAFDGNKYCCVNDKDIYVLEAIPEHEAKSKDLDMDYQKPNPQKRAIPSMNHPWRKATFGKFVKKQEHHWNDELSAWSS